MQLTYQQAYDKIIDAYFKDEIEPYSASFCFCGTLVDGDSDNWERKGKNKFGSYTGHEYGKMESALLTTLRNETIGGCDSWEDMFANGYRDRIIHHPNYEAALFSGMSAGLDVLKSIHESRGENTEIISQPFTKRQLA